MNCPIISVIVPVYNMEEYLERCVDSIIHQTESNIEIILVNNGSTDRSGAICDKYSINDDRVKVIHQPNNGVSAARNSGIKVAKGDYIGFVDADDWIEPDMYESLFEGAVRTDADVVMCDATTVYNNGNTQADTITQLSGNTILSKSDFLPSLLLEMAGSAWRCIYSKRIYNDKLRKFPLAFPLGVKFSEDRIFNLYAFGYANRVYYIKQSFYNRYMNLSSAVHRFHPDYFDAVKKAHFKTQKAIDGAWDGQEKLKKAYLNQFISGAFSAINNYYYKTSTLSSKERRALVRNICNDVDLVTAIRQSDLKSFRAKWIEHKQIGLLILFARINNAKHKR